MYSAIRARLTRNSLRARLTFWYVLTLGATLTVFASGVMLFRARSAYDTFDAEQELRGSRLAEELRPDLFSLDVGEALASDSRASLEPLCVRTTAGVTIFRSPTFPDLTWAGEGEAMAAARDRPGARSLQDRSGESFRLTTIAIPRPGADRLVLQITEADSVVTRPLEAQAFALVMTIGFVLVAAAFGSRYTVSRALAPVDSIVARARDIQTHNLGERLDVRADSEELDRLVTTLNAMLDRIQASVATARRFAADASHELQTPIAAIRGMLDMGLRQGVTAAQWREQAVDLLEDVDRLSELVRDLRLIAMAEAGHLLDEHEAVPMVALVQDCCETASVIAGEQQIRVETAVLEPVAVSGSSRHLRRVVLNLLQNAVRYSPEGATVHVSVGRVNQDAVVTVGDSGCGIDPADLPHIFEPFFRADPARARDTGGTGLGLAIVEQIVRAHGGHVEVSSALERGSTFSVVLPAA